MNTGIQAIMILNTGREVIRYVCLFNILRGLSEQVEDRERELEYQCTVKIMSINQTI